MQNNQRPEVGRRTVVRTVAWSAPAVAVVAAAPAYAATGTPNLSTSTAQAPTRNAETFSIPAGSTTFANSGTGDALGLTATVSFTTASATGAQSAGVGDPTIVTDLLIGGNPYGALAGLVDVTGIGTNTVIINISDTVVTIAAGDSFSLPLGLDFVTDNAAFGTTMSVEAVANNGGPATNFAPTTFAAPSVNISTSTAGAPTRTLGGLPTIQSNNLIEADGDAYTYDQVSIINTGDIAVEGVTATLTTTTGVIRKVLIDGVPVASGAATASGLNSGTVVVDIPASEFTVAGGATKALPTIQAVSDNRGNQSSVSLAVKAKNGGNEKAFGASAIAAATGVTGPNLSTTSGGTITRASDTQKDGQETTFRNTGTANAVGILTIIETDKSLQMIQAKQLGSWWNVTAGSTMLNGGGFPGTRILMQVSGSGLANMTINAGSSKVTPPQRFQLTAPGGSITIRTTTYGLVNGQPQGIPLKSSVTVA